MYILLVKFFSHYPNTNSKDWNILKMNDNSSNLPLLVLISGCHASGKRTAANLIETELHTRFPRLQTIKIDMLSYFTVSNLQGQTPAQFDFNSMQLDIITKYRDMDIVILFGLYALYDERIRNLATVSVYLDCDSDVRLGRWIKRDVLSLPKSEHKQKLEQVLDSYLNFSRDEMKRFIAPTKDYADVILPRGADDIGIAIIVDGLQPSIEARSGVQLLDTSKLTSTTSLVDERSASTNSGTKQHLQTLHNTPSVLSLNQDNFTNQNKRFYDIN